MEREVIAKRNTNSAVLDLVLAGIGACLLAYMIYLICTSEGLATIAMGIVIAVICAAFFACIAGRRHTYNALARRIDSKAWRRA